MQAFPNIATFTKLSAGFILLLFCSTNFTEVNLNVGRELQCRAVEGAGFLLRQACLELLRNEKHAEPKRA